MCVLLVAYLLNDFFFLGRGHRAAQSVLKLDKIPQLAGTALQLVWFAWGTGGVVLPLLCAPSESAICRISRPSHGARGPSARPCGAEAARNGRVPADMSASPVTGPGQDHRGATGSGRAAAGRSAAGRRSGRSPPDRDSAAGGSRRGGPRWRPPAGASERKRSETRSPLPPNPPQAAAT